MLSPIPFDETLVRDYLNLIKKFGARGRYRLNNFDILTREINKIIPSKWYSEFKREYEHIFSYDKTTAKLYALWKSGDLYDMHGIAEFATSLICYKIDVGIMRPNSNNHRSISRIYEFKSLLNPGLINVLNFLSAEYDKNIPQYLHNVYDDYGYEFTKYIIESDISLLYNRNRMMSLVSEKNDILMFRYIVSKNNKFQIFPDTSNLSFETGIKGFTYSCGDGNLEIVNHYLNVFSEDIIKETIINYDTSKTFRGMEKDFITHYAPVIAACIHNRMEIINLLLSKLDDITIKRIDMNGFNLATLSIMSMNFELVDSLMSKYNLGIMPEFIHEICKSGTIDMLLFGIKHKYLSIEIQDLPKLFKDARHNIPILEYILNNYDTEFLKNMEEQDFFDYMVLNSVLIQQEVFKYNSHYLENIHKETTDLSRITYYNETIIKSINNLGNKLTTKVCIYSPNGNYLGCVFIFKAKEKYIVSFNYDYKYSPSYLRVLNIPKNRTIVGNWVRQFKI